MATKKLVPRATNEGGLGTALKVWGASWLQNLTITNLQTSTSVNGLVENAGNVEKRNLTTIGIDVQDTEDPTCYVGLWEEATGTLLPKTDEMLTYNALTNILRVGTNTLNTSYYSNNILARGAPFNIRSENNTISLSANEVVKIHSDANDINFSTGATPTQVGHLSNLGLIISNLPAAVSPTKILVESTTVAGLVSHLAMSSIVPNLQTLDEGSSLTTTTQSINYVGDGVTTTVGASNDTTVTIPGTSSVLDTEHAACFVGLYEAATGNLLPKTDEGLTYNALTGSEMLNIHGGITMGLGTPANNQFLSRVSDPGVTGNRLVIKAGTSGAGTNLGGGQMNLHTGLGTGNAGNPSIQFISASTQASGTTAQLPQGVGWAKHVGDGGATSYNQYALSGPVVGGNPAGQFEINCYPGGVTTILTQDQDYSNGVHTADLLLDIEGDIVLDAAGGDITFKDDGSTSATVSSLRTESFMMACSDETTALTAGTDKVKFRMPYAFTVTEVRASLSTAGTGAQLVTVDIHESGTTILSTKITIDATETTSVTAATAPVISDTLLADDAEITVDIDLIDTGGVSKGLKVAIIGHKTV